MKAGGERPTAPKEFMFYTKRFCTQQANIFACSHRSSSSSSSSSNSNSSSSSSSSSRQKQQHQ
jgi:hypothetical protein